MRAGDFLFQNPDLRSEERGLSSSCENTVLAHKRKKATRGRVAGKTNFMSGLNIDQLPQD